MMARTKVVVAIVCASLPCCVIVAVAFAAGLSGNFHSPARIISAGHAITVGGQVSCAAGDAVSVRATITQPATGSYGEGTWTGSCSGTAEHWGVTVSVTGRKALQSGCVEAAALAITTTSGSTVAAQQWFNRQLRAEKPHQMVECLRRL